MDNYTIQVLLPDDKWKWIIHDDFAAEYLVASPLIENDVVWFNTKSDALEYIESNEIVVDSDIITLKDDGQDQISKILGVRIVRVEAVEV